MHITNEPYLKNKNINMYLERLSQIMIENNIDRHEILVVGGAAMALKNRYFGRATVDIDMCFEQQNNLYKCCLQVADEYNIPKDWMNADVMHSESFSYRLFEDAKLYKSFNGILDVYIVSDINLLCMKLVSFRPKDKNDIDRLVNRIIKNKVTYTDVMKRFAYLYGNTYPLKSRSHEYILQKMNKKK